MFLLIIWTNFWVSGCGSMDWRVRETSTEVLCWVADESVLRKDYADLEIAHRMEIVLDRRKRVWEDIEKTMNLIDSRNEEVKRFMEFGVLYLDTPWFKAKTDLPAMKFLFILCKFFLKDFGINSNIYEMRFGVPIIEPFPLLRRH